MNLGEQLLYGLKEHGISEIFGIPGDFALPFFKVIEESNILPAYYLSHEPAVGFAADAAARIHGKPSVAAVTYGAGGFNMVNPIASAYAEKSPVVVISGGPGDSDKATGLLVHHQAKTLNSQLHVYKEVTCDQAILNDLEKAPEQIARVLENCKKHSRPVYIEIPRDKVFLPCGKVPAPKKNLWEPLKEALEACADDVLSKLENAKNPILVAGVEVRRFALEKEVAKLAKLLDLPVVTTLMGRGLFAEEQGINLKGTYLGSGGNKEVRQLVEEADVPFLLGVLLNDNNFALSGKAIDFRNVLLASDGECSMGYHAYPGIPLAHLIKLLIKKAEKKKRTETKVTVTDSFEQGFISDEKICTPNDIAILLNDLFKNKGKMPIASDMGDCFFTTLDIMYTPLVAPGFYATMGFGIPAGIGLQIATKQRPLILVGDGAFQMTGWELLNLPRYNLNPIVLVFNNASWEMLRTFQPESEFNNLPNLDFSIIANGLGGKGLKARNRKELKESLDTALADTSSFYIIDIKIEKKVLSKTLGKFVSGLNEMRSKMNKT